MHIYIDAYIQTLKCVCVCVCVCTQVQSYTACKKDIYRVFQDESALL